MFGIITVRFFTGKRSESPPFPNNFKVLVIDGIAFQILFFGTVLSIL